MKLQDFVQEGAVRVELEAVEKSEVIRELVHALKEAGALEPKDVAPICRAIIKREAMGSTGIGRGVAIPHAKHKAVDRLIGTVGRSSGGVEFNALDGDPVHIVFLLVSPPDAGDQHLKALERVMTILQNEDMCRFLKQASSVEELVDTLKEADEL